MPKLPAVGPPGSRASRAPAVIGLAIVAMYTLVSFRVGTHFPFHPFPMFSKVASERARVFARVPAGQPRAVQAFDHWHCPGLDRALADTEPDACGRSARWGLTSLGGSERLPSFLARRRADQPGPLTVEIVERTWWVPPDDPAGPIKRADCVVLTCTAHEAAHGD